ncbi:ribbon-helix-helix protein, CopG family [Novosphingobium sp. P6W]|uniref:ribbon-helix-helix protein, CopG family n=1 Tax=Novosphingobium sp. P6W TaxID=1609758 RepID=UPI0005C2B347|nr:ribbon-helix-helix protein, CopG family [Novosphingobium sp. P6W]AXB76595.1 ribbon-helix-helix protein, CopG family [Novosphingobium sp. P6W]KIS33496.1 CopG domain-containing protein [Novosphingobium sp. P6W]
MSPPRIKYTVRLPADLARQVADHARARRASQTAVIEAALLSFLSPDGSDRLEAAVTRRLDRLTRQFERLEWHVDLSNETLALFIRSWLTSTSPLPDSALQAAQAMGKERWESFVEALTRRMEMGPRLKSELSHEVSRSDSG